MKIVEVIKISFTFVGTIIGAGFASGKEIALYFSEQNIFAPLTAGLLIGLFAWMFSELGRMAGAETDILGLLFKKLQSPVRRFIELANYITFIAMIAGAELIVLETFHMAGGGIFSAMLSFVILLKGNNGMKILNTLLVPVIIIAIVGLGIKASFAETSTAFSILTPISYASMNLLTGGYLIGSLTKRCSKKENLLIGIFVAAITSILLCFIYKIVLLNKTSAMPVGAFAASLDLKFVSGVLIYLAILTTMVSSLKVSAGGKAVKTMVAIAVGFLLSLIGFEMLVENFYPLIGYAGIGLSVFAIFYLVRCKINIVFCGAMKKNPEKRTHSLRIVFFKQHGILLKRHNVSIKASDRTSCKTPVISAKVPRA